MTDKEEKRWIVTAEVTISVTTIVHASSEKKARALAKGRGMSMTWRDDGDAEEEWTHDELDGTPSIIGCEEFEV